MPAEMHSPARSPIRGICSPQVPLGLGIRDTAGPVSHERAPVTPHCRKPAEIRGRRAMHGPSLSLPDARCARCAGQEPDGAGAGPLPHAAAAAAGAGGGLADQGRARASARRRACVKPEAVRPRASGTGERATFSKIFFSKIFNDYNRG